VKPVLGEAKAMATEKQFAANRQNGLKGGVKTEEGKAISRLNARKHGIFAVALTPEDSEEVYGAEDQLIASLRPVGRVEEMLVEKPALTYLRMQRCARAEAELHVQTWKEPIKQLDESRWYDLKQERRYGGRGVPFREAVFDRMVKLIDLYDARLTNQFLKLLHEIERQQRLRAAAAPQKREELNSGNNSQSSHDSDVIAPQKSPDPAPEPAAAQTSSPLPQPPSAVPPPLAADADLPADAGTASALPEEASASGATENGAGEQVRMEQVRR
jgi:hypothetical protein